MLSIREGTKLCHLRGLDRFDSKMINLFPKQQNLDSSKLKEFADDSFIFYENGKELSKRVENTLGKGEIAHYEQFLLFPQCFQNTCNADM